MSKSVRLRFKGKDGIVDVLTITVHPEYVHFRQTRARSQHWLNEIYIPRRQLTPILRWLMRAARQVDPKTSHYPPEAERLAREGEELYLSARRLAKRQRSQAARVRREKQMTQDDEIERRSAHEDEALHALHPRGGVGHRKPDSRRLKD